MAKPDEFDEMLEEVDDELLNIVDWGRSFSRIDTDDESYWVVVVLVSRSGTTASEYRSSGSFATLEEAESFQAQLAGRVC